MNSNLKLSFKLTHKNGFSENIFSYVNENGTETLSCTMNDGFVCRVFYDFREKPLVLSANAQLNDSIEIILMPHRIELWVNSALMDEEWPAGNLLFSPTDKINSEIVINVEEYVPQSKTVPTVIGEFENAEGWQPEENVFVGDCMPYVCDDRYHVLYLKDRHHHCSKWGLGAHQWEHISTKDFKTWQIHPMAVEIDDPMEGSICTGSWIKNGNTHYLFYTVRMSDGSPAPIRRCISEDGYHFTKDKSFSLTLSEKYHGPSARDPKLVLSNDGTYHMFITTSVNNKGCLAHLVSRDMNVWKECDEPIYTHNTPDQPECSDYIAYNGYYYLIFSIGAKARYMYSKEPFGSWMIPDDPIIPCSSVPKGGVFNEKIVFSGFKGNHYAGTMTFKTAINDENGILIFE